MSNTERFFRIEFSHKWDEVELEYQHGKDHHEIANRLPLTCKRVYNERYREIEDTGTYYRITENCKGGKALIFEVEGYILKKPTLRITSTVFPLYVKHGDYNDPQEYQEAYDKWIDLISKPQTQTA